jgi:hypothetical protein
MAFFKARYVKKGKAERQRAKATIRYITHRPGKEKENIFRQLFGHDGPLEKDDAYQAIDAAPKGTYFYRMIINPDPKKEDTLRDLYLPGITKQTILRLEKRLNLVGKIQFFAAVHNDHSPLRHVHLLVLVPGKLTKDVIAQLHQAATEEAVQQRQQRDQVLEAQRQQAARYLIYNKFDFEPSTPPPNIMACADCGTIQPAEVLSRILYRCVSCGHIQSRYSYPGAAGREARPQLSL